MSRLWLFCLLASFCQLASGYNVLVTVLGVSGSQNLVMFRLAEQIAARGHEVTVLRGIVDPNAKTVPMKNVTHLAYTAVKDTGMLTIFKQGASKSAWGNQDESRGISETLKLAGKGLDLLPDACEALLDDKQIMKTLKAQQFDVAIIHLVDFCGYGLAHMLNIQGTIWFSTAFLLDPMAVYSGVPAPAAYVCSGALECAGGEPLSIADRFKNIVASNVIQGVLDYVILPRMDKMFKRRVSKDFPAVSSLLSKTQLYFVNADPMFEPPRPILHNIIYVGGLTMSKANPLSEEWAKRMEDPRVKKHGFGMFSLGTVADTSTMPMTLKENIVRGLSKLPQKFYVRLAGDLPDISAYKNLEYVKWMPQKDLVAHPSVRVFITHAGYNSITESTFAGVPLVMLPVFADQMANAKRVERAGMGKALHIAGLTSDAFAEGVRHVVEDPSFKENARRLAKMIQNKPVSSLDAALGWIEFLAEFKELPLHPASVKMPWYRLYNVDLILLVHGSIFLLYKLLRKITGLCCGGKRKQKRD